MKTTTTDNIDQMQELARLAVACRHWRWIPGMLVMSDPDRVPRVIGSPVWSSELRARVTSEVIGRWYGVGEYCVDYPDSEHETMSGDDLPGTLPDLTDPATIGCVVSLVREIYPDATTQIDSGSWWVAARNGHRVSSGQTEAEALIGALKGNDATESG